MLSRMTGAHLVLGSSLTCTLYVRGTWVSSGSMRGTTVACKTTNRTAKVDTVVKVMEINYNDPPPSPLQDGYNSLDKCKEYLRSYPSPSTASIKTSPSLRPSSTRSSLPSRNKAQPNPPKLSSTCSELSRTTCLARPPQGQPRRDSQAYCRRCCLCSTRGLHFANCFGGRAIYLRTDVGTQPTTRSNRSSRAATDCTHRASLTHPTSRSTSAPLTVPPPPPPATPTGSYHAFPSPSGPAATTKPSPLSLSSSAVSS